MDELEDAKKTSRKQQVSEDAARLRVIWEDYKNKTGITQAYFAEMVGISKSTLSHYLGGRKALELSDMVALCRAFQVSLADISPSTYKCVRILSHMDRGQTGTAAKEGSSQTNLFQVLALAAERSEMNQTSLKLLIKFINSYEKSQSKVGK